MTEKKTMRNSNIEILRVIAMFFIVASHFPEHGGIVYPSDVFSLNRIWCQFLSFGGNLGTNLFMLISGYFLITNKSGVTKKCIKFAFSVLFYSWMFYLLFVGSGTIPFSLKGLLENLFPLLFSQWWFASAYFFLLIVSPFLNEYLTSVTKDRYLQLLSLLSFFWVLIPTVLSRSYWTSGFVWFVYLYMLSGYIRLHVDVKNHSSKYYFKIAGIVFILTLVFVVLLDLIGLRIPAIGDKAMLINDSQKLPIVLTSLFLFLGFLRLEVKKNRMINTIASSMFGVYLIHENVFVRPWLWQATLNAADHMYQPDLILYSILCIVAVFVICSLFELLRIHSMDRLLAKPILKLSNCIDFLLQKAFVSIHHFCENR